MLVFTRAYKRSPARRSRARFAILRDFQRQKPAYYRPESPGMTYFGDGFAPDSPLQRGVRCEPGTATTRLPDISSGIGNIGQEPEADDVTSKLSVRLSFVGSPGLLHGPGKQALWQGVGGVTKA